MKTFVVGDIHGAYRALIQVLDRCGFDYEVDELITIGDIVDGWKDSFLVVEELLKIKNRIDIVGNHDQWFIEFLETTTHGDAWSQGGLATAKSYAEGIGMDLKVQTTRIKLVRGFKKTHLTNLIPSDIPESHQQFFKRQARFYKDDLNNVFVHGGMWRGFPLNETPRNVAMWDRKLWNQALSAKGTKTKLAMVEDVKNIFIGHSSTVGWGSFEPMNADVVWNLDTGAGGDGKLTIMDVDTKEYWQSDFVYDLYEDDAHRYEVKKFK